MDRTRRSPAAVERAAAIHPDMRRAMTHLGRPAMCGLAMTMMSLPNQSSLGLDVSALLARRRSPEVPMSWSSDTS